MPIQRPPAKWSIFNDPSLVVAQARLVMREEHLPDQLPAAANARLLEHALEVLLDRVGRDAQPVRDLRRRVTAQDQPRDVLLSLGQLIGGHQQGRDARGMGGLDDDGYAAPVPAEEPTQEEIEGLKALLKEYDYGELLI